MEPSKTSPAEQGRTSEEKGEARATSFGTIFDQNSIKIPSPKATGNQSPQNIEFDAKVVPKWNQNRCPKSSKINAKTGNEKDQENHPKTCFSEW